MFLEYNMENTTLIALLSPILLTVGGIISWFLKSRNESLQLAEQLSREKRLETYKIILDPYLVILSPHASKELKDEATKRLLSVNYKKASFDLVTFGSDNTVRSFNKLMQYPFNKLTNDDLDIIVLFSEFTLNVRKDLYSKKTKLDSSETLEFTITDIKNYKDKFKK